ncbi:LacI family DNA-binding transcriptional regulator [Actinoplanes sp. NPDC051411]|uniref:LacI family DNA-binding transcriptional regulator n=1 Tax=Actinoplanes sp. NPDC051411 TaxID=3155522 RepID=UPI00343DE273
MAKSPTVYDVAQAAGVSIATVSFTFSRPSRVKPATRAAVLAAAQALGYVPSASARGLAVGHTKSFGLIFWDGSTPPAGRFDQVNAGLRHFPRWVHEVQYGIERAAWSQGYAIMVGDGDASDVDTTAVDIAGRVDGLVLLPHMLTPETLMRVAERIPVVSVTEGADHPHLNSITVDNRQGMTDLVRHLVEAHGIRSAEFVGATGTPDYRARFAAFRDTLEEAGIPAPAAPAAAFPTSHDRTDAYVCRTDADALALLEQLQARGVRVPEDVIVTGFDGLAAGLIARPTLTSVRQPMHDLGVAAVELLLNRIADPESPTEHRRFPVELTVRQSCGCR